MLICQKGVKMTDSGIKKKIKNEEDSTSKQINPAMQVKTPSLPIKTEFTYKESEKKSSLSNEK